MPASRAYLDWNATAPLRAEARTAMAEAMEVCGNPSSVHAEGRAARALIERARARLATALGADGCDIVFTAGATDGQIAATTGQSRAPDLRVTGPRRTPQRRRP